MSRRIRRTTATACACVLLTGVSVSSAWAQTGFAQRDDRSQLAGYIFAAPLVRFVSYCTDFNTQDVRCEQREWSRQDTIPHAGAAVEWQPVPSLGLATEAGAIVSNGRVGGIFAVNGTYYVRGPQGSRRSLVPFATGGYAVDTDREHGINAGGGVSYRRSGGDAGLRLEVRSTLWEHARTLELRLGVSFGGS